MAYSVRVAIQERNSLFCLCEGDVTREELGQFRLLDINLTQQITSFSEQLPTDFKLKNVASCIFLRCFLDIIKLLTQGTQLLVQLVKKAFPM